MRINFITLFPQIIESYFTEGIVAAATKKGLIEITTVNPRSFTTDVHGTVDDKPFGGGQGMLMMYEPLKLALESIPVAKRGRVYALGPAGTLWHQSTARGVVSDLEALTIVCGRYEGLDQRFINEYCDDVISIGDFVLTGGELAALAMVDSIARLVPGVLGNSESPVEESFSGQKQQKLEGPQFTRPREVRSGARVPTAFLSGHHKNLEKLKESLSDVVTALKRPDLPMDVEQLKESATFLTRQMNQEELEVCGLKPEEINQVFQWESVRGRRS